MTVCGWPGEASHADACPWPPTIPERLEWLCTHGSSLCMSWDGDAAQWQVSWITSGERTTAVRRGLNGALDRIYQQAVEGLA